MPWNRERLVELVRSGIPVIDERLGGFGRQRSHLISGGVGTGKTIACLQFLDAGLRAGQRAALLTHDDPTDLLAQSRFIGGSLDQALRDGRVTILRYHSDFVERFHQSADPSLVFSELREMLGEPAPQRLVVDSVNQLVPGGLAALGRLLDQLDATSVLTWPGDIAVGNVARLEPLIRRAAMLLHFVMDPDASRRIEVRKVRHDVPSLAPIPFVIQPGTGLAAVADAAAARRFPLLSSLPPRSQGLRPAS